MDRRGFLKVLGLGGVAVAAAPKLLLPPARNVVAEPERRIFLPPSGGWVPRSVRDFVLPNSGVICEEQGRHIGCAHDNWISYARPHNWTLRVTRSWSPSDDGLSDLGGPMDIGGATGFLMERAVDCFPGAVTRITERYVGTGPTPNVDELKYRGRVELSVEHPRELFQIESDTWRLDRLRRLDV